MAEVEGSLSPDLHRSALERGRKADKAEKAERKEKRRQRKAEREAAFAADAVSELKDDQSERKDQDKVTRASPPQCCVPLRWMPEPADERRMPARGVLPLITAVLKSLQRQRHSSIWYDYRSARGKHATRTESWSGIAMTR